MSTSGSRAFPFAKLVFSRHLDLYMPYLDGPVTKCDDPPAGTTGERTCVDNHVPLWRVALPPGF